MHLSRRKHPGGFTLKEAGIDQLGQDFVYVGNLTSVLSNRSLADQIASAHHQRADSLEECGHYPIIFAAISIRSFS